MTEERPDYAHFPYYSDRLERVAGIEPAYSAWKAAALPLSYTRLSHIYSPHPANGGGGWIRTNVAYATDLQSAPFNHSGTPPLHLVESCCEASLQPPPTI